jgi:Protein of unknown function (DUF742)
MKSDEWSDRNRLVPPYAITGGRARPALRADELELETLISTTSPYAAPPPGLGPEQQAIVGMCRAMQSIAEVSAHLDVPVGVARVLISDLALWGLITLHRPDGGDSGDLTLLERVLQGLRTM